MALNSIINLLCGSMDGELKMKIRYLTGRAGQGKSSFIYREIKKSLQENRQEKLILLVPEQFTLQAERDLLASLNEPGIMQVEVMSISSLARRVLTEVGGRTRILLNQMGKNMVLQKLLDENADQLSLFKKAARKEGFINQLSELLAVLKQEGVTPQELEQDIALNDQAILADKLKDIALLYRCFNDYLQERYIDTEDRINLLVEKLDEAEFLHGALVWIDGFTTFSTQSLRIIEKIIRIAGETTVSLTLDPDVCARDRELFALSRRSLSKLHELAVRYGIREEYTSIRFNPQLNKKNPELLHLEKELYAYPWKKFNGEVKCIKVLAAPSIFTEVEKVAQKIIFLVREKGYRWRDIAVICADMDSYAGTVERVFSEYGIPSFIDTKRNIMDNPIIQAVLAVLDIVRRGYRYEDVFKFFKTGFSDLKRDQYEKLENYALEYGIKGAKWKEEFIAGDEEIRAEMNNYRKIFMEPLKEFAAQITGSRNVAQITWALYDYLISLKLPEKLTLWIENLKGQDLYELVYENTQIWNTVMKCLEQSVEILGDCQVNLNKYREILEAGFLAVELGIIPTAADQVLVGSIHRSKSQELKALFVVGINDGTFPSAGSMEGLLSDRERDILRENFLEIGLSKEAQSNQENFIIYSALSKATEELYISYPLATEEGKALRPSLFIERIRRLYPSLELESCLEEDFTSETDNIATACSTFKYLIEKVRRFLDGQPINDIWWAIYNWYFQQQEWHGLLLSMAEGFFYSNQLAPLGEKKALALYQRPLKASVSRLELFNRCPFAHFVRYGLNPSERKEFVLTAPDIGEFFHKALQFFGSRMQVENIKWHDLSEEKATRLIAEATQEMETKFAQGILGSSFRYQYLFKRLSGILNRTIGILAAQIKSGEFEPLGYEIRFGAGGMLPPFQVDLSNGEKVYLEGRIDRLDWLDKNGEAYIRIIDYKSGERDLKLSDILYGLNLQLLLYLSAVLAAQEIFKQDKLNPAGMFYFKIDDPLIDLEKTDENALEDAIRKKFKMKGWVLEDVRIVRSMDRDIKGYSQIIPVALNQKDGFYNSAVLNAEDFKLLTEYARKILQEIGEQILAGNVAIEPIAVGNSCACDYCLYKSICQFDRLLAGNNFKNIPNLNDATALEKIKESMEGTVYD